MMSKQKLNHGFILVNKPVGYSSQYVVTGVKIAYNVSKAGHSGTLDKMASGMLPVFINEATKYVSYLTNANKTYTTKILFGYASSTGDIEGLCVKRCNKYINASEFLQACKNHIGYITQIPPIYSALKVDGQPMYKFARAGKDVVRKPRSVQVFGIDVVDYNWPWATIRVNCSKGTYIRTLVEDIASSLGSCAYVVGLHRDSVAGFSENKMQDFLDIKSNLKRNSFIMPIEDALFGLNRVELSQECAQKFIYGQLITISSQHQGEVMVFSELHGFLGIGRIENSLLRPKRLMQQN